MEKKKSLQAGPVAALHIGAISPSLGQCRFDYRWRGGNVRWEARRSAVEEGALPHREV